MAVEGGVLRSAEEMASVLLLVIFFSASMTLTTSIRNSSTD